MKLIGSYTFTTADNNILLSAMRPILRLNIWFIKKKIKSLKKKQTHVYVYLLHRKIYLLSRFLESIKVGVN